MLAVNSSLADVEPVNIHRTLPPRNSGGGGPNNRYGLTAREEAFAREVSAGKTYSEAYRLSYAANNMKPSTVWRAAHDVARRPRVRARIDQLAEAFEAEFLEDAAAIRAFIRDRLFDEAADTAIAARDRLRALELLGKLTEVAAFTDRSDAAEQDIPAHQVRARILALLARATDDGA